MAEPASAAPYPVRLEIDWPERQSRWKALFRLPLSIPLLVLLAAVQAGAAFATFVMWVAIVAAGRPPRWLFDFVVAANRWSLRAIAYMLLLTDEYAPFGASQDTSYEIDYPQPLSRWRVGVWKFFTSLPHLLILYLLLTLVLPIVTFIGWLVILITSRWPPALHEFAAGLLRWPARVQAYGISLTDEFPPFGIGPRAGPAGKRAVAISGVAAVPLSLLFGVCVAVQFIPVPAETREISYDLLLTGNLRPEDARVEVTAIERTLDIDPAPRGTVELTAASDPATDLGSLFSTAQGNRFLQFELYIESGSLTRFEVEATDFTLKDLDDKRYEPVLVLLDGAAPPASIGGGESIPAIVVFEVPVDTRPAELRVSIGGRVDRDVVYRFQ